MFEANTSPVKDDETEDFDALYDEIMEPNGDGPSVSEDVIQTKNESQSTGEVSKAPPVEPEYEYTWSGQKIKAPLSEVLKKASMGHDYAQKMAEFNRQQASIREQLSLSEKLKEQYGQVDEWVRGNPDKWEKLQAVIEAEKAGHGDLDTNHPLYRELQSLKQQLNEKILPSIQAQEQEKLQLKHEAEDKTLNDEIQSIREKYKDLDWESRDELGRNRELQVLRHAHEHGYKTFKAAFLDLYHDDLEKRAEERGKVSAINERQKLAKTGLLGKTSAPTVGLKKATNVKNKTWSELGREAKEELGLT